MTRKVKGIRFNVKTGEWVEEETETPEIKRPKRCKGINFSKLAKLIEWAEKRKII